MNRETRFATARTTSTACRRHDSDGADGAREPLPRPVDLKAHLREAADRYSAASHHSSRHPALTNGRFAQHPVGLPDFRWEAQIRTRVPGRSLRQSTFPDRNPLKLKGIRRFLRQASDANEKSISESFFGKLSRNDQYLLSFLEKSLAMEDFSLASLEDIQELGVSMVFGENSSAMRDSHCGSGFPYLVVKLGRNLAER